MLEMTPDDILAFSRLPSPFRRGDMQHRLAKRAVLRHMAKMALDADMMLTIVYDNRTRVNHTRVLETFMDNLPLHDHLFVVRTSRMRPSRDGAMLVGILRLSFEYNTDSIYRDYSGGENTSMLAQAIIDKSRELIIEHGMLAQCTLDDDRYDREVKAAQAIAEAAAAVPRISEATEA